MAWRSIYFVGIFILIIVWTDFGTPAFGEDNAFTILFGSEATMQDLHREVSEVKQGVSESRQSLHEKHGSLLHRFDNFQSELTKQYEKMLQNFTTFIVTQLETQRQKTIEELKNSQQHWFNEEFKRYETNLAQTLKAELGKQLDSVQKQHDSVHNLVQNRLNDIEKNISNNQLMQQQKLETQSEQTAEHFNQTANIFIEKLNDIIKPLRSEILTIIKNNLPTSKNDTKRNDPAQDSQPAFKMFFPKPSERRVEVNSVTLDRPAASCDEAIQLNSNETSAGIYALQTKELNFAMPVYCLPDPNGGPAWLVIQRRGCDNKSFDYGWNRYTQGFGYLNADFFIGLATIRKMMLPNKSTELWIQLGTSSGESPYEIYKNFVISDAKDGYNLESAYEADGTAGDELTNIIGERFQTWNTKITEKNCAVRQSSGWWYPSKGEFCGKGNLNRNFRDLKWGDYSDIIYTHMAIRQTYNAVEVEHRYYD